MYTNCAISNYPKGDYKQEHSKTFKLHALIIFYDELLVYQIHQPGWWLQKSVLWVIVLIEMFDDLNQDSKWQ